MNPACHCPEAPREPTWRVWAVVLGSLLCALYLSGSGAPSLEVVLATTQVR